MAAQPTQETSQQVNGSTNTVFNTQVRFDSSYLRRPDGIIKIVVIILNILGFICIVSSPFRSNGRGVYFCIVAHVGLWFSGVILLLYLYHLIEKHHTVPWLKIELLVYVILTFSNLIASTIAVAFGAAAYSAAGFFGYLAMVLYGVDAFLKAHALKKGELAQGTRIHNKQVIIITPPPMP